MRAISSVTTATLALALLAGDAGPLRSGDRAGGAPVVARGQERGASYLGRGRWRVLLANGLMYDGYPTPGCLTDQSFGSDHIPRAGGPYISGSQ